jgi:hypothetical protein
MPASTLHEQNPSASWPFRDQNSSGSFFKPPRQQSCNASTQYQEMRSRATSHSIQEVQPPAGPMMVSTMQAAAVVLNQSTTIPLPCMDKDGRQAINDDHNLSKVVTVIQAGPLSPMMMKAELVEKAYFDDWKTERLVVEHLIAMNASGPASKPVPHHHCGMPCIPMAGHSGDHRMMYRVISRFRWPYVA